MKLWLVPYHFERTTLISMWCAAALLGIAFSAAGVRLDNSAWVVLGVFGLLAAVKHSRGAVAVVVISGLIVGLWRGSVEQQRLASLASFYGKEVVLSGKVAADPSSLAGSRQTIRIAGVTIDRQAQTGVVQVVVPAENKISRGDRLVLKGVLQPGFGSYQARVSYARQLQVQSANAPEIRLRDAFAASVRQAVPEPEASLGLGFLLGQRSVLPTTLEENFKLLGLTHIVVASGYNLTVLVRLARRIFEKISKFQVTAVSLGLVAGFVTVTGFSPSMTRAALVTLLTVWAWHYGRRIHPLLLIVFVAAATGLWNPFYVWSDVGWYLSFLAFAGVLLLAPLATHRLFGERQPSMLLQVIIETICAQAATLPLILYFFGLLPVLSLVANVLVVPFIPLAMLLTFLAGVVNAIVPVLGPIAGLPARLLLSYIVTLTDTLAGVPWASLKLPFSLAAMAVSYGILVLAFVALRLRTKYDFLQRSFIE